MRLRALRQIIAPYVLQDSLALLAISPRVLGMGWHKVRIDRKLVVLPPDGAKARDPRRRRGHTITSK